MAIQWLGSARERGMLGQDASCGPDLEAFWDPQRQEIRCRDIPTAGGIRIGQCPGQAVGPNGCVPVNCPAGSVRIASTGECLQETNILCGPGKEAYWDTASRSVKCRGVGAAGRLCPPDQILGAGAGTRCVPYVCPPNTVRDTDTGICWANCPPGQVRNRTTKQCEPIAAPIPPPAPGECLSPQQVIAAQPCFYFDARGDYIGPPELVQGVDILALRNFCRQTLEAGYFDLPLCDPPATVPAPPACLTPEQRGIVKYCRERGWTGDNRAANYVCWTALKAPAELGDWEATPDCQPSVPPVTPPAEIPPGELPPPRPTPIAQAKKSSAAPILIGAAVVAAAAYYFLS